MVNNRMRNFGDGHWDQLCRLSRWDAPARVTNCLKNGGSPMKPSSIFKVSLPSGND